MATTTDTTTPAEIRYWDKFVSFPAPTTLETWAHTAIIASFSRHDPAECIDVYGAALEYIGWLNSLPTTV